MMPAMPVAVPCSRLMQCSLDGENLSVLVQRPDGGADAVGRLSGGAGR